MEVFKQVVKENKQIISAMAAGRFPNPKNPRKIGKKWYQEEVVTILATGQTMLIEKLINTHTDDPYKDVDELIGDLQLIGAEVLNQFNLKGGVRQIQQYGVDDFFAGGRLIRKDKKESLEKSCTHPKQG